MILADKIIALRKKAVAVGGTGRTDERIETISLKMGGRAVDARHGEDSAAQQAVRGCVSVDEACDVEKIRKR